MQIEILGDTDIRVSELAADGIHSAVESGRSFGPMTLFMSGLALCTFNVLKSYGERIEAATDSITMRLRWKYGERPHRIAHIDMEIHWPEVPESRLDAATRAAAMCTLHRTLEHSPEIETQINP